MKRHILHALSLVALVTILLAPAQSALAVGNQELAPIGDE